MGKGEIMNENLIAIIGVSILGIIEIFLIIDFVKDIKKNKDGGKND